MRAPPPAPQARRPLLSLGLVAFVAVPLAEAVFVFIALGNAPIGLGH